MGNVYSRNCPYLYRGVVEDNVDSMNLGRCRVRVPAIHGKLDYPVDALPWARPLVLSPIKSGRGSVNIPDVGDIVWVLFEGADRDYPIYLGGTYAKGEIDIDLSRVDFYIEGEDRISYRRDTRECEVIIGDTKVLVSPSGVDISGGTTLSGDVSIRGTLTVDNIVINNSCNKAGVLH